MRRFALIVLAPLAACTVGPDYRRPILPGETGSWVAPANTATPDLSPWQSLGDPMLVRLIEQALAASPDLAEARGRLAEARALRDAAVGRRLPEIDATGSAQQQQLSRNGQIPVANIPRFDRNFSLFDLGFDASWEIDLWGGTRRSVEAAGRQVELAAARLADTRLQIVAEVARSYGDLRAAQALLASARADADAQAKSAMLVAQRFRAGEAARIEDRRAESQARTAAAALPGYAADARTAAYQLAVLTGQPPEALLDAVATPTPVPVTPANVAVGLRSDVLRRRPDVRAAEADLAAATANIGAETANLFPRFSLIGNFGQQARSPGDLVSVGSMRFQVGPSFRWPIFDAGRVRANIRAADARADQAAARYTKAVLNALADSETAVNRYAAAIATIRERASAREASAASLDLVRQRYRAGEDDLLALLEAQLQFAAADRGVIQAEQQAFVAYSALVKALGGGASNAPD